MDCSFFSSMNFPWDPEQRVKTVSPFLSSVSTRSRVNSFYVFSSFDSS